MVLPPLSSMAAGTVKDWSVDMAQEGIDYFPLDTGFLRDKKVLLVKGKYGAKGILILLYILTRVYEENGYYIKWDEDDCFLSADAMGCGITPELTTQVVHECVVRSMFDEQLYNEFGILTSHGIQKRFVRAAKKRENIEFYKEYFLLDTSNVKDVPRGILNKLTFLSVKVSGNEEKVSGNSKKVSGRRQSKVKESKVEENKNIPVYAADEKLNRSICDFVDYRKKIKSPMTDRAIELLIMDLNKLSGSIDVQIEILNQSIVHGWKGVFPLKEQKAAQAGKPQSQNRFHNFEQRDTDYDAMVQSQTAEWLKEVQSDG